MASLDSKSLLLGAATAGASSLAVAATYTSGAPRGELIGISGQQSARRTDPDRCRQVLDQLLRQTVISRLRLAHQDALTQAAPMTVAGLEGDCGEADMAQLLRHGRQSELDRGTERMVEQAGIEAVFLDRLPLLVDSLRAPGDQATVTLARWRLQEMVERLSPRLHSAMQARRRGIPHGRRVVLLTPEPLVHGLRMSVAAECMLAAAWEIWCEPGSTEAEMTATVQDHGFDLAMVASDGNDATQLGGLIRVVRRASCNRNLRVLVVSEALARRPDRLARLGVDAAAGTVRQACAQAQRLLSLMPD